MEKPYYQLRKKYQKNAKKNVAISALNDQLNPLGQQVLWHCPNQHWIEKLQK